VHIAGNAAQRHQLGKVNRFVYHRHARQPLPRKSNPPSLHNPGREIDTPGWPHFDTLVGPTPRAGGRGPAHRTGRGAAASCTGGSGGSGAVRWRVQFGLTGTAASTVGLLAALVRAGETGPADGGLGPGVEAADGADDPGCGFEVTGAWTSRHRRADQVS